MGSGAVTMRRAKPLTLLGIALAGALSLMAGSQAWVSFMLQDDHALESITGHEANSALSPIALALVAAALALTIAGSVFRRVLGVLVALLGVALAMLSGAVIGDPLAAAEGRITELTGISGDATLDLVVWSSVSGWAWAGLVAGAAAALLGLFAAVLGGRWRTGGRKYDQSAAPAAGAAPDRISDWDALSSGKDPSDDAEPDPEIR